MAVETVVKANGKTAVTSVTKRKLVITPLYFTGFVKTPVIAETTRIKLKRVVPRT